MASRDPFETGTRVLVFHELERLSYTALIDEAGNDSFTIMFSPVRKRKPEMGPGSTWEFCLIRDEGLYYFSAPVVECIVKPGLPLAYRMKRPALMRRQQRRGFVRLSCCLDVLYWRLEQPPPSGGGKTDQFLLPPQTERQPGTPAQVLNLSGGGLKLLAPEYLPRRTGLFLQIHLDAPEARVLAAEGLVERVQPVDPKHRNWCHAGVSFRNINRGTRERIIRYIFRCLRLRFRS